MQNDPNWVEHHAQTKSSPPSPLLLKALPFVAHKRKAIDVGAGGLKDTKYLLDLGFDVTALDIEPTMLDLARELASDRLHPVISSFDAFDFSVETYDLATCMFSLPFGSPETFDSTLAKIKRSLISGGVFCAQLFGDRDEWSINPQMTFHRIDEARALFEDMDVLLFEEREWQGMLANGTPKRWHIYNVIARKPGQAL